MPPEAPAARRRARPPRGVRRRSRPPAASPRPASQPPPSGSRHQRRTGVRCVGLARPARRCDPTRAADLSPLRPWGRQACQPDAAIRRTAPRQRIRRCRRPTIPTARPTACETCSRLAPWNTMTSSHRCHQRGAPNAPRRTAKDSSSTSVAARHPRVPLPPPGVGERRLQLEIRLGAQFPKQCCRLLIAVNTPRALYQGVTHGSFTGDPTRLREPGRRPTAPPA